jgi:hydroxyacylglutathione hydrolase
MILERVEHPGWLSNAYLLADREGGSGVLVDSNGLADALLDRVARLDLTVTHVVLTHHHEDHVVGCEELAARLGVPLLGHPLVRAGGIALDETIEDADVVRSGDLSIEAIATPGHCPDHLALLVDGTDCLTADCLFKGTVGGTLGGGESGFADQRRSIMDRLMSLPPDTRVHPGHAGPTTIAAEWEGNPFVRVWRGIDPRGEEPCLVQDEPAALVLWGPDYDGTHKAWVQYADGSESIVGGSRITRPAGRP